MTKPFIPSSWNLLQQIKAAEAKFDAAREQSALREVESANDRYARRWAAEADANRRRRLFGDA